MIDSITKNSGLVDYNFVEDGAMGKYFNGILGAPMLPNRICFFEDILSINEIGKVQQRMQEAKSNNKDHYRVKTAVGNQRSQIDMFIYQELLKCIYDININIP